MTTTVQAEPARAGRTELPRVREEIDRFLKAVQEQGMVAHGLAVGVLGWPVEGAPVESRSYVGWANARDAIPVGPETVFEIGSVSKTFTTTMLAARVLDGSMELEATAQSYYDLYDRGPAVRLPVYTDPGSGEVVPMRMLDLADFTSGITSKSPTNVGKPNEYPFARMHAYLEHDFPHGLPQRPGTRFVYVNTNFGIIADLLMRSRGYERYGQMLRTELLDGGRLGMRHTGVVDSNTPHIPNLAQGYDANGAVQPNFALNTWPALQGAGAIASTLDDMLEWLRFNMRRTDSPLNDALDLTHREWFRQAGGQGQGLGWFLTPQKGFTMIDKNGGTSGFHAFIGFGRDAPWGVVVLCNAAIRDGAPHGGSLVDALGIDILRALVHG